MSSNCQATPNQRQTIIDKNFTPVFRPNSIINTPLDLSWWTLSLTLNTNKWPFKSLQQLYSALLSSPTLQCTWYGFFVPKKSMLCPLTLRFIIFFSFSIWFYFSLDLTFFPFTTQYSKKSVQCAYFRLITGISRFVWVSLYLSLSLCVSLCWLTNRSNR